MKVVENILRLFPVKGKKIMNDLIGKIQMQVDDTAGDLQVSCFTNSVDTFPNNILVFSEY